MYCGHSVDMDQRGECGMFQIDWNSFANYNQDARGIQFKFEDLCRQLFQNEFLSGNKKPCHLHSNPNNPGLETEPVYDEIRKQNIGFQSKYFETKADYKQIQSSVEKIISNYKGQLDCVYLYCNKDLNSSSLERSKRSLEEAHISLELITNNGILDQVRKSKNHYLALYYFGNHQLSLNWFIEKARSTMDTMGERYNSKFNVETNTSNALSLFVRDSGAAEIINAKKSRLIDEIEEKLRHDWEGRKYLYVLRDAVSSLPDVVQSTIEDAFEWKKMLEEKVETDLEKVKQKRETLQQEQRNYDNKSDKLSLLEEKRKDEWNRAQKIQALTDLMSLPGKVAVMGPEELLLKTKVLAIHGNAGVGKTQLLAHEAKSLLDEGRPVLLLAGGNYLEANFLDGQIMKDLQLDFQFDDLLDILEAIGERQNVIVPVFIDALNETWHFQLWKKFIRNIVDKVRSLSMVRLVISYRSEYAKSIFSDSVLKEIEEKKIIALLYKGLTGKDAVSQFLDYYHIPFSTMEDLEYGVENPLFLTLFCKLGNNGVSVGFPDVYERIIDSADDKIHEALHLNENGYVMGDGLLHTLLTDIVKVMLKKGKRFITPKEILGLSFWDNSGLSPKTFVAQLERERILADGSFADQKIYFFAFDQMNDYFGAKIFVKSHTGKEDLREALVKEVLGIKNGTLENPGNVDLFVHACAFYAAKYREECIDLIGELSLSEDKRFIFSRYITSLQWRKQKHIHVSSDEFIDLLAKYPFQNESLWKMLIGNSLKIDHILNANFLHRYLMQYSLKTRDYQWTIYINQMTEKDRLVQLVDKYQKGDSLNKLDNQQIWLLLILFGWLLCSSNRKLRDCTSKAMIEILKNHFSLCQPLLEKFERVNDPYVLERLYGVVFGACCKRETEDKSCFQELALYVYNHVFDQETVYPDILLRDYARMIIERFVYECPRNIGGMKKEKWVPPYQSAPIPVIQIEYVEKIKENCGMGEILILRSMKFAGMGGVYGDFGRYIFQSAVQRFAVNDKEIYRYAVYFIFHELGYSDDYFGDYDFSCIEYDRSCTIKTERIGKKYEWIVMHNILARVADNYQIDNRYDLWRGEQYEGPWELSIRDFDPTLNAKPMIQSEVMHHASINFFQTDIEATDASAEGLTKGNAESWLNQKGQILEEVKRSRLFSGINQDTGVAFTSFMSSGSIDKAGKYIWVWAYAYFVTSTQKSVLKKALENNFKSIDPSLTCFRPMTDVFNREYSWAPSCKVYNESDRISVGIDSGAVRLGEILCADSELLWENEYDGSKDEIVRRRVPCTEIMEMFKLRQGDADGIFLDEEGKLAAYNLEFSTSRESCLVVRKNLLDKFQKEKKLHLVWILKAGKEIHDDDGGILGESCWSGLIAYSSKGVTGSLKQDS